MKIEIELSELEALRAELLRSKSEKRELEEKLKELSEPELKAKAVRLSYRLFDNYMAAVFKHLGFGDWQRDSVKVEDNLEHWIGKDWWNSDKIKVEIGANVTAKFRNAFLSIGIITEKETKENKVDVHELI